MSGVVTPWKVASLLFSVSGALAFLLTAVGLAGLVMFLVAQRTREIGIRMALGAQPGDAVRLVLHDSVRLTLIGCVLGLAGAAGVARLLTSRLYQVSPIDPTSYLAAVAALILVALLASYLPARRAATVDPATVLRAE